MSNIVKIDSAVEAGARALRILANSAAVQLINSPVESELPGLNATKAGQFFWYNGELWTYAKTGQFGTLAQGAPWPFKGYKEISLRVFIPTGDLASGTITPIRSNFEETEYMIINNIGLGSPSLMLVSGNPLSSQNTVFIANTVKFSTDSTFTVVLHYISGGGIQINHPTTEWEKGLPYDNTYVLYIYPPQS